jgi:hypothetical protein
MRFLRFSHHERHLDTQFLGGLVPGLLQPSDCTTGNDCFFSQLEASGHPTEATKHTSPATNPGADKSDAMLAAISIGQILAVLVTLNLIVLSFAAYRIMRRK